MEDMQRLVRVEESVKSAHHRLDKLEKNIDEIHSISLSVHEIATEMKAMRTDITDMNNRVRDIENKPAKRWDGLVDKALLTVAGAVIGYFLTKIGLG